MNRVPGTKISSPAKRRVSFDLVYETGHTAVPGWARLQAPAVTPLAAIDGVDVNRVTDKMVAASCWCHNCSFYPLTRFPKRAGHMYLKKNKMKVSRDRRRRKNSRPNASKVAQDSVPEWWIDFTSRAAKDGDVTKMMTS